MSHKYARTERPWEGECPVKPWDYQVTAVVPCRDTTETLSTCLQLLRLQTVRPYLLVIDTGSGDAEAGRLRSFQAEDCEVHFLRPNAVRHPSDPPAMAMDLAFAVCQTEYLFATHSDCFLRRRDFLEDLIVRMAQAGSPVAGYEISPRAHQDWRGMVSHTATMFHMPAMYRIGAGWGLRRLATLFGVEDHSPCPSRPGWPDTEILINYLLRHNKLKPVLVGSEQNFTRTLDENIDHFRSYTSSKMYNPDYFREAEGWFRRALADAEGRIEAWKKEL